MEGFIRKLLGGSNESLLKQVRKTLARVEALEDTMRKKSDAELKQMTPNLKAQLQGGKTLDDILPEAFAAIREAAYRIIGQMAFPTQILGAIVLHQGRIAELLTGEGKTLMAVLPAYLNALSGKSVHIVTVNDYLATYQGELMGQVHRFMGLSVGLVLPGMSPEQKRESYACDIVYGTNNEFGFDYLRDNMVVYQQNRVQRDLTFAIVDEVDSILIDEARTPLIISGMGEESTELYERADRFVRTLREGEEQDYTRDEKQKSVILTEFGVKKAEAAFQVENLSDMDNTDLYHHIIVALKAHTMMKRDVDYVVKEGEILIVDEFTGRLMIGRRYSDGLHQAIEAKEHVKVAQESRTLATNTFQNYFRMYEKLSGMTGTAKTEENEFKDIYKLDVVVIPTYKPMIRQDFNDMIYRTQKGKYDAVVEDVVAMHAQGRPVLVGTVSVEKSEMLSSMLSRRGIKHDILNAKQHEREAEIIAQAGKEGAVTIATNMAGRGTDILLGGNPSFLAMQQMRREEIPEEIIDLAQGHNEDAPPEVLAARERYRDLVKQYAAQTQIEHEKVVSLGGLHIIGTERHEARRIDNQLRGRSGRQGDPGSSRFFVALDDDLMRLFGGERIAPLIERLGLEEDAPIEAGMLTKQIESAQKRVEGRNFEIRRNVLQYDDVMNIQRGIIYSQRAQVLRGEDIKGTIQGMLKDVILVSLDAFCAKEANAEEWDWDSLREFLRDQIGVCPIQTENFTEQQLYQIDRASLEKELFQKTDAIYDEREALADENGLSFRELERVVLLRIVDQKWMDHIDNMDRLREGVTLRAIGQRDPIIEYKREGFEMFEEMVHNIKEDTVRLIFHVSLEKPAERRQAQATANARPRSESVRGGGKGSTPIKAPQSIGRNALCPCGSGKKYKNCHGRVAS